MPRMVGGRRLLVGTVEKVATRKSLKWLGDLLRRTEEVIRAPEIFEESVPLPEQERQLLSDALL